MLVLLAAFFLGNADAKPIRLRHETITPDSSTQKAEAARLAQRPENDDKQASGLFLVQLAGSPKTAWREELRARGVDLLQYVPEDTFVARFDKAKPGQIRKLDFVRWVGEYKSDYKVHALLNKPGPNSASETVEVAVLLSPDGV